jgi:hypothetical protein
MSTLQNGRIVTDGLVFYMDASNSRCYSGTGSSFEDLSLFENNGVLVNGVSYTSEYLGGFTFDGINDIINVPYNESINPDTAVSISAVFNVSGFTSFYAPIIFKQNGSLSNYEQYQLGIYGLGELRFYVTSPGLTQTVATASNVFNKVIHSVGTCDTTTNIMNLYVNGELVDSKPFPFTFFTSSNSVNIGGVTLSSFPGYTTGKIYQSIIYNRALTQDEVRQNFQFTKTRFGL